MINSPIMHSIKLIILTQINSKCFVKPIDSAQRSKETRKRSSGLPPPKSGQIRRKTDNVQKTSILFDRPLNKEVYPWCIFLLYQLCIVMLNYKNKLQNCRASHSMRFRHQSVDPGVYYFNFNSNLNGSSSSPCRDCHWLSLTETKRL